jgi:hypothetical protein
MTAICQSCQKPFTARRATARYCSGSCRVAAHRASAICNATEDRRGHVRALESLPGIPITPRLSVTGSGAHVQHLPSGIVDAVYPGMYRILLPGGGRSDMVNLTRAKDAVRVLQEGE